MMHGSDLMAEEVVVEDWAMGADVGRHYRNVDVKW